MPINSFSIGKDISFTLVASTATIALNGVTDYSIKPMFTKLTHKGLDGTPQFAAIPDGWEITIKLDRQDPTVDNFFVALEASYFAGTNISGGTISETITEVSGTVTSFQYTSVSLSYEDAGSWKGDSFVPITLVGRASRKQTVS